MLILKNLYLAAFVTFLPLLGSKNEGHIRIPHGRFGGYTCLEQQIS